jgi:hypothetical protein
MAARRMADICGSRGQARAVEERVAWGAVGGAAPAGLLLLSGRLWPTRAALRGTGRDRPEAPANLLTLFMRRRVDLPENQHRHGFPARMCDQW